MWPSNTDSISVGRIKVLDLSQPNQTYPIMHFYPIGKLEAVEKMFVFVF